MSNTLLGLFMSKRLRENMFAHGGNSLSDKLVCIHIRIIC